MKITLDIKDYEHMITNLQIIASQCHPKLKNEDTKFHNKLAQECLEILGEDEP
jgi:hypothetical protein